MPPAPSDFVHPVTDSYGSSVHGVNGTVEDNPDQSEEDFPLISSSEQIGSGISNSSMYSLLILSYQSLCSYFLVVITGLLINLDMFGYTLSSKLY